MKTLKLFLIPLIVMSLLCACSKEQYKGNMLSEKQKKKLAESQDYLSSQAEHIVENNLQTKKKREREERRRREKELKELRKAEEAERNAKRGRKMPLYFRMY